MSYAPVRVGDAAPKDLILAAASRQAAEVLLRSLDQPKPERDRYIRTAMRRYGPGAETRYASELRKLRRTRNESQAVLDAMRLVVANRLAEQGAEVVAAANRVGLGDETAKAVGCGITGGVTALLALIGGAYTAGAAAPVVGAAGGVVASQIGCGSEQQAAAQQTAAQQAAAAAALTEAANQRLAQEAAAEAAASAGRRKTLLTIGAVGGGALLLLGVGYAIIKV